MQGEWIRFGCSALFAMIGAAAFLSAMIGVGRFNFCLNRLHAAAIADTVGVFSMAMASIIYMGVGFVPLKEFTVIILSTLTSPVSTHMLSEIEFSVSDRLTNNVKIENEGDDNGKL